MALWTSNPQLCHEFKRFGPAPIHKWSANFDYQTGQFKIPLVSKDDQIALRALDFTWNHYEWLPAHVLVELTHAEGTPWRITLDRTDQVIEDDLIQNHYRNL